MGCTKRFWLYLHISPLHIRNIHCHYIPLRVDFTGPSNPFDWCLQKLYPNSTNQSSINLYQLSTIPISVALNPTQFRGNLAAPQPPWSLTVPWFQAHGGKPQRNAVWGRYMSFDEWGDDEWWIMGYHWWWSKSIGDSPKKNLKIQPPGMEPAVDAALGRHDTPWHSNPRGNPKKRCGPMWFAMGWWLNCSCIVIGQFMRV